MSQYKLIMLFRFLHYSVPIKNIIRSDYATITLSIFDRMVIIFWLELIMISMFQLSEYLTSEMMSEKKADLRTQVNID